MLEEINYTPPLGKSDHLVLCFKLTLYTEQGSTVYKKFNFFKADYMKINDILEKINWNETISSDTSMNGAWENFTNITYNQFQENIPVCEVLRQKYNTPWMNKESLTAIMQKPKSWNKYIHYKTVINKNHYKEAKKNM